MLIKNIWTARGNGKVGKFGECLAWDTKRRFLIGTETVKQFCHKENSHYKIIL